MGSCAVNPECGRETIEGISKAAESKKVVVIGGGPAGMEAARVSALRGHKVTLFEKKDRIGGALIIGGIPSFKKDDLNLVAWYEQELKRLGAVSYTHLDVYKRQLQMRLLPRGCPLAIYSCCLLYTSNTVCR